MTMDPDLKNMICGLREYMKEMQKWKGEEKQNNDSSSSKQGQTSALEKAESSLEGSRCQWR